MTPNIFRAQNKIHCFRLYRESQTSALGAKNKWVAKHIQIRTPRFLSNISFIPVENKVCAEFHLWTSQYPQLGS